MYINYRLALAKNEEARRQAELQRFVKAQRAEAGFVNPLKNFFSKSRLQKRGKYGLQ